MSLITKLCAEVDPFTQDPYTEPEVLLDGEKRVGKMADLPEDMVVRGSIVFEYPVQVESQYMMEEAAAICRLQRRLVCYEGRVPRDKVNEDAPNSYFLPEFI